MCPRSIKLTLSGMPRWSVMPRNVHVKSKPSLCTKTQRACMTLLQRKLVSARPSRGPPSRYCRIRTLAGLVGVCCR